MDATPERVLIFLAPAGYGKTTLARQWLASERTGWYACTSKSVDVAILANGIASALEPVLHDGFDVLRQRLRVTQRPETESALLAELLADAITNAPTNTWLVVDDYEQIAGEPAAEEFLATLLFNSSVRALILSRVRPSWATARQVIYGEIAEIGTADLVMTPDEVAATFSMYGREPDPALLSLAGGWPALVTLLAKAGERMLPTESNLSGFLAAEVCRDLEPDTRTAYVLIAAAGSLNRKALATLLGDARANKYTDEGLRRGILSEDPDGTVVVHDVLRAFLLRGTDERSADDRTLLGRACAYLLDERDWDRAFSLATDVDQTDLLTEVIVRGVRPLLDEGRTATVRRWIEHAALLSLDLPILRIAQAELSIRDGLYLQAETLSASACDRDIADHERYWGRLIAGRAAHLAGREQHALTHYQAARALASTAADERIAAFGELAAAVDLELDTAAGLLGELEETQLNTPDDQLRLAGRSLSLGTRLGSLDGLERAREARQLVPIVGDPYMRTSFLNSYGYVCAIAGEYDEANEVIALLEDEAKRLRLSFVLPYAQLIRAIVLLARRAFDRCLSCVDEVRRESRRTKDAFVEANAAAIRARGLIAQGRPDEAFVAASGTGSRLPRSMFAELEATRALALACAGRVEQALALAEKAERTSRAVEVPVLARAARCIALAQQPDSETRLAESANALAKLSQRTGYVDGVIAAYRGFPELARLIARHPVHRRWLIDTMRAANDEEILRVAGLGVVGAGATALSAREAQVFRLMQLGGTNRAIASELFISEATVKVHVHHIYEKLGVHNRAEAILKAPATKA